METKFYWLIDISDYPTLDAVDDKKFDSESGARKFKRKLVDEGVDPDMLVIVQGKDVYEALDQDVRKLSHQPESFFVSREKSMNDFSDILKIDRRLIYGESKIGCDLPIGLSIA